MYDLVLINTNRQYFASVPGSIYLGTTLLAQFLRQKGYKVGYFSGSAHTVFSWLEEIEREEGGTRSVGFYCDYENLSLIISLCQKVKEKWNIPVFIGGPQAVGLGKEFLSQSQCDAIVRGEGELTMLELLESSLFGRKAFDDIDGIAYLDQGEVIFRPDRKPIVDLDSLPWVDFRMLGDEPRNSLMIMTGRGCPYRCAFCYEGNNSRNVRLRSVENVRAEIVWQLEKNPDCKYIHFIDNTFTLNPKRVEQLCQELVKLRKQRDFLWFCEGHVENLYKWPWLLEQMADAGLAKLFIGIESGSNAVLKEYNKCTTTSMIEEVVQNSVKAGIRQITGNIIIGGPHENHDTLADSFNLIKRLTRIAPGRFYSAVYFMMPYPNTAITCRSQDFGLRLLHERKNHSLEDIPLTESEDLSWQELFTVWRDFERDINKIMRETYDHGLIPDEVALDIYHLATKYGVYSRWINILEALPNEKAYFQFLITGGVKRSRDIPDAELMVWRPLRVFSIWSTVRFSLGYPQVGKQVLSPLEYELLLLCSGKLGLQEVLDQAYVKFTGRFTSRREFENEAKAILRSFEQRHWLVYANYAGGAF